eukprot:7711709-Heterocapsa_arctica.AAC.1
MALEEPLASGLSNRACARNSPSSSSQQKRLASGPSPRRGAPPTSGGLDTSGKPFNNSCAHPTQSSNSSSALREPMGTRTLLT